MEDLPNNTNCGENFDENSTKMDVDINLMDCPIKQEIEQSVRRTEHFFAKFLTNPKLLALQLSDANFRRAVLVQFLILFQYLQITVKFKS